MSINSPIKPGAPTDSDQSRWDHSSLRKRLILGAWLQDLERELARHLPPDRREAWGPADLSSNPFEQITRQLAVLYHENPSVTNSTEDISSLVGRSGLVTLAGLWPLMARAQQMILGMREAILRIDVVSDEDGIALTSSGLQYRLVTSDMVYLEAHPDQPDIPTYYVEYRLRSHNGKAVWIADCLDIRDPNYPTFRMHKVDQGGELGIDVSDEYMGGSLEGESYPYRDSQGRPFLPIVLYHAEKTGHLWDSFSASTMVYGSLTSATLYTMWVHLVRDSCWAQKYVAGLSVAGLNQMDQDQIARRSAISTDPSSILVFAQDPDAQGQPLVGTFQVPVEPAALLESIAKYETRVALAAGLSPADISRQSGDPRSGYALAISRSGQREAQKKYAPVFRMGDEELLAKSAMLANRFLGTSLPESGYRVSYHSMPLSPDEIRAQREDIIGKMEAGLMSPVQAIMQMYDDMDEIEAKQLLTQIRRDKAEFQ
tara:strand:+ start:4353 stop:5807 length:1455 start_codon:yes stop_codon:yes gene_type:complete